MNRLRTISVAVISAALMPFAAAHAQQDTKKLAEAAKAAEAANAKVAEADKAAEAAKAAEAIKAAKTSVAAKVTQTSVAAKDKKFAVIKATDAAVKSATDAKNVAEAKKLTGKNGVFSGTVAKVVEPAPGLVLIEFDRDLKSALTAVVGAKDFAKFPDLKTLEGQKVLISGKVDSKGSFQVTIDSPDAIKIIK